MEAVGRSGAVCYPEHGNESCAGVEQNSAWFRHRNDCIAAVVRRYPPPGTFWDIGAGNGFVAQRLAADGLDVVVVEPGPDGARRAREYWKLPRVIESDWAGLNAASGSLAGIGFFDVVEHVREDGALMDSVAAALTDGGRLYIAVPAHNGLWSSADEEAQHARRYSLATLRGALPDGMHVLYATYFFAPLLLPIALLRALPYRLGVRPRPTPGRLHAEHGEGAGGLFWSVLAPPLAWERRRIEQGSIVPFGASCLIVAEKKLS